MALGSRALGSGLGLGRLRLRVLSFNGLWYRISASSFET